MERVTKQIKVFTDGSADPQKEVGAWAALILNGEEEVIIKGHARHVTHQQMELQAVLSALKFLIEKNVSHDQPVTIYTDSQYVVRLPERKEVLEANDFKSKKGKAIASNILLREFYQLCDQIKLILEKVPAHQKSNQGFDENRQVDKLVRKMVRSS